MNHEASTALLRDARRGSPEAFSELSARVGGRLLAWIRLRMGRDLRARVDSGDILQATWLKSFQRIDQFEGGDGASLMGWLAKIAENEIRDQADYQHRLRRDADLEVSLDAPGAQFAGGGRSALSQAVASQEAERLADALETLDADHRKVIVLRKLEELSFKDVAARMQRSEDACRMLLARAMVALTMRLRGSA